jgi:Lon protease-like protein
MESSELDRLEECVKRAFSRIETLDDERKRLAAEKLDLETRLKERMTGLAPAPEQEPASLLPSEKFSELKARLTALIGKIEDLESKL